MLQQPFGIYLHWPFCTVKCPYCNFNSYVANEKVDEFLFAAAFRKEIHTIRPRLGQRLVTSIFIGGGTPSLMQIQTVSALLEAIYDYFTVAPNAEITLEANPSSAEANRFKGYHDVGVNRLSLGVQSLNEVALKYLGRQHGAMQAIHAIELARNIFPRLSFDLIYALPNQSKNKWKQELEQAISLASDHLSLYQLTIEQGTAFFQRHKAGKLQCLPSHMASELYILTQEITNKHSLPNYEISNHATPDGKSQHNLLYWRYGQYVGFGPGAHGRFIEKHLFKKNLRTVTIAEKSPKLWLERVEKYGHGILKEELLTCNQQADEMLLMGLRLYEGLNIKDYESLAKKPLSHKRIEKLQAENLVEIVDNLYLRATVKGRIVLNYIITELAY